MPFTYSLEQNRVVFKPISSGCGQIVFLLFGSVFTVIGVLLILFNHSTELPFSVIKWVVPIFGLLAFYAGVVYPKRMRLNHPDELVFDNNLGRIEVVQKESSIQKAYIYYDEIEDLIIKTKSHSSSSNRTYHTYHIHFLKKDGGQWELMKLNSHEAASAELEKLKSHLKLEVVPERVEARTEEISKLKILDDHVKTVVNWQNPIGSGPLFLFIFSAIFLTIFWSILGSAAVRNDFGLFGYLIGGFMLVIFSLIIAMNTRKMIKNANTIYTVIITDSDFTYAERDKAERVKKARTVPLKDLHAITFSYSSEDYMRKLFVYTHEQFMEEKNMEASFSVSFLKKMYNFYTGLMSLEIHGLTIVEMLHLENYLQQQIAKRGKVSAA